MACKYTITVGDTEKTFNDRESLLKYIRENQLVEDIAKKGKPENTTETLANVLRQVAFGENNYHPAELRDFQEKLLDEFIRIETQSEYFYKTGKAVALTKGLGKSFEQVDNMKKNLADLGLPEYGGSFSDRIPFDVRYLITGNEKYKPDTSDAYYHKITANNLRITDEIDALARTMFMERTPTFINTTNKVVANLKPNLKVDKVKEIKDELSAFSQIAAYKQWIKTNDRQTSTLRNSLIYDGDSNLPTIVDITKQAIELAPSNVFLQFILPVSTTVKVGKKQVRNIINRDLINTIEGKTRGRLEPDMVATIMDSFTELYQNPKTRYHAKALFDYLIVKDGLMFKNKSFIRMIPTAMFADMSDATGIATKLMAANTMPEYTKLLKELAALEIINKEGAFVEYFTEKERSEFNSLVKAKDLAGVKNKLFNKIFGLGTEELYNKFEETYATDVNNQFNLDLVRLRVTGKRGLKVAEGIKFHKDETTGINYMHVNLFTEKYKALPKESEESKAQFIEMISDLDAAGFPKTDISETDNIEFKKYVRVRGKTTYQTYKLISVRRNDKDYKSPGLTPVGELIPRGISAIYEPVIAVGASNTTGSANLGTRPTPQELQKLVLSKVKKPVDNNSLPENMKTSNHSMTYKMPAKENLTGKDTTTLELSEQGLRTGTTRSYPLGKVGDIITFEGRPQQYTITSVEQLTSEKVNDPNWIKQWSGKEQWTVEHFKSILGGKTVHVGSWQTSYTRLLSTTQTSLKLGESINTETPNQQEQISTGIFGGLQQLPYDPSSDGPLGNFTDDELNEYDC